MMRGLFIPAAILARLIANGRRTAAGEDIDPPPVVKLFVADTAATWLLTELDPAGLDRAFGLCDLGLGEVELGYVSLSELGTVRGRLGLPIEIDRAFEASAPLSRYTEASRTAGHIVDHLPHQPPGAGKSTFTVGQRVTFWSGRGSQGGGTIRAIKGDRAFIDPDPDAQKGSDYRAAVPGSTKPDRWAPRDLGVRLGQLNTPPKPWFKDN